MSNHSPDESTTHSEDILSASSTSSLKLDLYHPFKIHIVERWA